MPSSSSPSPVVRITVRLNGQSVELDRQSSVATLLEQAGHAGRRVAVERNGDIVPRSRHATELLEDGDRIEIVQAIGGG